MTVMNIHEYQKKFDELILPTLNEPQRAAVTKATGSLLVIAGAGSGKTRVITARILYLITHQHVPPHAIVALTFTNKAAQEMRERIAHFLGSAAAHTMFIGTFHAYCLALLRKNGHLLKTPAFTILDGQDQEQLISLILKRSNLEKKVTAKNILYQISLARNRLETQYEDQFLKDIAHAYEREKQLSNAFDFDDLLIHTYRLFVEQEVFKETLQEKVRHILVDEYQDTNVLQHEFLKQMALKGKKFVLDSLCAVGDEDQSIYSWRGATVHNILHFKKDFPKTEMIKLEQNYRCAEPILEVANHVIQHNSSRNPKKLWSEKKARNRIQVITCSSGYQEADTIAQCIKAAEKKFAQRSIGILYRTHYQSRMIEEALIKNSIAYKIIGGIQFYERQEIKDLLAYLKLIANPFDRVAFFRIINVPARGLGDKFEQECKQLWDQEPFLDCMDLLQKLIDEKIITARKAESVQTFLTIFKGQSTKDAPRTALEEILKRIHYFHYLQNQFDPQEAVTKIDNIKELLRALVFFEEQGVNTITSFLSEVALMQEKLHAQDAAQDYVLLMSLHAAKGLEFDVVCITGLEEGIFPSTHSRYNPNLLEEERRLFYVGITRAKEYLIITHAHYRNSYGTMQNQTRSAFLKEIPNDCIQKQDGNSWNSAQYHTFFSSWFGTTQSHIFTFGSATGQKSKSITAKTSTFPITTPFKTWREHQPVKHPTFGIGTIKKIEENSSKTTYITVAFKEGIKKIKADFLSMI